MDEQGIIVGVRNDRRVILIIRGVVSAQFV